MGDSSKSESLEARQLERATRLFKAGQPFQALNLLLPLLKRSIGSAEILAIDVYLDMGLLPEANALVERTKLHRHDSPFMLRHAKLLATLGQADQALLITQRIADQEPDHLDSQDVHLQVLDCLAEYQSAIDLCNTLLDHGSLDSSSLTRWLALLTWRQGSINEAQSFYEDALKLNFKEPLTYYQYGMLLKSKGDLSNCYRCWRTGLYHARYHAKLNFQVGFLAEELGDYPEAQKHFKRAWSSHPCYATMDSALFVLPEFFADGKREVELSRRRFLRSLDKAAGLPDIHYRTCPDYITRMRTWSLGYQPAPMKAVMVKYSKIVIRSMNVNVPLTRPLSNNLPAIPKRNGKIRLALVSNFLYDHSNQRVFEGFARHINKQRYTLTLVHGPHSISDQVRDRMDGYADHVLHLSESITDSTELLSEHQQDVLFFTDLGMSAWIHAFASIRHAPIQATTWGVPYTSGLSSIDYYISSALAESKDAKINYTEQLHLLSTLPACYPSDNIPKPSHDRAYFFLPDDKFVFGCLQNVAKYHPDFDELLEAVAVRCPDSVFVFAEHYHNNVVSIKLLDRWARTAPSMFSRIHFVASMSREEYISICNCIDLLLDPPYFGSGVSFYESISTGTPTVTLKGKHLRSRFLYAAYRKLGLAQPPVAQSFQEYVEICSKYYHNRALLAELKADVIRTSPCLYDDLTMVRECEDLFSNALATLPKP